MDQMYTTLLEKHAPQDAVLKELWDAHIRFDKQVIKMEGKQVLSPIETQELKRLKKEKLDGKTKLMALLDEYRAKEV